MTKPVYSLNQIINRIDGGISWSGSNVTFSIPSSSPTPGSPESAGFVPMSSVMKSQAAEAYGMWDDVMAIHLTKVAAGGQMTFSYSSTTGGSTYTGTSYTINGNTSSLTSANTWLDSTWTSHNTDASVQHGEYGYLTYLHEIGHALGLNHPGNYDGSAVYASDAIYQQDTLRYSVMSYFDGNADGSATNWTGANGIDYFPETPMVDDVATVQRMYGADMSTRAGNTTYGFHSTAGRAAFDFSHTADAIVTIWDGSGTDTIDLSGYSNGQRLNLNAGSYSNVGELTNNLGIAFGAIIENGIGGAGNDQLIGNGVANTLSGGNGNDALYGGGGNDALYGGAGADNLYGGAGKDAIDGGAGIDTVYYSLSQASYTVAHVSNHVTVTARTGADGIDTLSNVEKIHFLDHTILI